MARQNQKPVVELSAEQESLAQRVYEKLRGKADEELLGMVRLMMSKADHEIFGPGEFELRDKLNSGARRLSPKLRTSVLKRGTAVVAVLALAAAAPSSSTGGRKRWSACSARFD